MRRPTSALAAAFLGTALVATSVSAQQNVPSLLGEDPASAGASGALTPATPASSVNEDSRPTSAARSPDAGKAPPLSAAVNPARTARTLVRNGWDFITYQEYDRALAFFKEADARKTELSDADRLRLKQGIAKARQAMVARAKGVKVGQTYALSDQKPASRPETTQSPSEPFSDTDAMASASRMKNINNRIPSALQAAMHEKDAVELPPLADERPRSDDQISRASSDNAPPEAAAVIAPAQPVAAPDPSAEPLPEPAAVEPASDGPAPAASPDMPPLPALPTLPPPSDLAPPEASVPDASASLPELPAATPETESAGQPLPAAAELQDPARSSTPAPVVESLPPLPASDEAPAAEAPGTPPPTETNAEVSPSASPEGSAARSETPTTVPDELSNTPRGVFGRDTLIPERRPNTSRSSLSPELQREVDEVARRQEENTARDRVTRPPSEVPDEEPLPGLPTSSITTKLEISRAPSSTEARPIRAIPVPEEFVPLPKREWNPNRKFWAAAATCHMPLYFQDATLERYGYSTEQRLGPMGRWFSYPVDDPRQSKQRNQVLQPFASMGLFAIQIGLLPWNLIMDPPWEAEYDLGFYRPGDRVPADTFYLPLTGVGPPLHGRRYGERRARPAAMPASRW